MCGEEIKLVAVRCKHCQTDLRSGEISGPVPLAYPPAGPPYAHPPQLLYDPPGPGSLTRIPTESTAMAGLLINLLFLPGLGSLIGGKTSAGVLQILMFLLGIPLCLVFIGIPMALGAWIWG